MEEQTITGDEPRPWRATINVNVEKWGYATTIMVVGTGKTAREAYDEAVENGVKQFWRDL